MKDVHTEHCCIRHGCKYGDEDCTVTTKVAPQSYECEWCEDDRKILNIDLNTFPHEITRACCYGKSCGNVTLRLNVSALVDNDGEVRLTWGYVRDNGDYYYGPYADLYKLQQALNYEYKLNKSKG